MANKTGNKGKRRKNFFSRFIQSPVTTIGIFALAAVLLGYGGVGMAQAIPTIRSDLYGAQISMQHIGVTLVEACNGNAPSDVASRDYKANEAEPDLTKVQGELLTNFGERLIPGKTYSEILSVRNTGIIDEFVRVTVRKYWRNAEGKEIHSRTISPADIDVHFVTGSEWVIDDTATTDERTVLYRQQALAPNVSSGAFVDNFTIDKKLGTVVQSPSLDGKTPSDNKEGKYIITSYQYNGYTFVIEATVDAVQTHNAEAAIRSAWGRSVTVSNDNTVIALN